MKHIFIVNPVAGKTDVSELIRKYVESRTDIECIAFNTEYAGHETELTKRFADIFDDETIRIYACGGSGTLCKIINGIEDFRKIEVGCFPAGMTNDFLKSFEGGVEAFKNLDALVAGRTIPVDIFDCGITRGVNSFSYGFETSVAAGVNRLSYIAFLGEQIPYKLSIMANLFHQRLKEYSISINGRDYSGIYTVVTAMNGVCYGGDIFPIQNGKVNDGLLDFVLYKSISLPKFSRDFKNYRFGSLEKLGDQIVSGTARELVVQQKSKKPRIMVDGEVFSVPNDAPITVKMIPAALKFVVPKGTQLLRGKLGGVTIAD